MRPIAPACGGGGVASVPSRGVPCALSGFIGFTPVQGGVVPMPFTSGPAYWKDLLEGTMHEIDLFRCDKANVPYVSEDFRPGMCGWRCSFMGETMCLPRCVEQYVCCSLFKCVRNLWMEGKDLCKLRRRSKLLEAILLPSTNGRAGPIIPRHQRATLRCSEAVPTRRLPACVCSLAAQMSRS